MMTSEYYPALSMIASPCYDKKKKRDCPDRHLGCHDRCEAWARYLEKRQEIYDKRRRLRESYELLRDERDNIKNDILED